MTHRIRIALVVLALVAAACTGGDAAPEESATTSPPPPTTVPTVPRTTTPPAAADAGRPVILDYSPTVSDLGALIFLASHPALRLVAVTLPGTGESHCGPGVAHTRGVLERLGLGDVPVACGPEDPLTGWNAFPTSWRVQSDDMALPEAAPNDTRSAPALIAEVVHTETTPVEIVAVGPLTNLAIALRDDPGLAHLVAGITIMGGAVDVPGNVIRNTVAEWNIWVDPTAAGVVFASGAPVTLVPLDATNDVPTSTVFFAALEDAAGTPGADLLLDIWRGRPDWYENPDGFVSFWDELAAAVLIEESLVEFTTARLVVDDDQRDNKGWTRRDETGTEVRVATGTDRRAFEQLFLDTVAGHAVALGYLEATAAEIEYLGDLARINADAVAATDTIFQQAATEMGIFEASSEDDFLTVIGAVLPEAFESSVAVRAANLAALVPPSGFAAEHERLVAAAERLLAERDELIAAFTAEPGFEVFEPLFTAFAEACVALQAEADLRLLDVDLMCEG